MCWLVTGSLHKITFYSKKRNDILALLLLYLYLIYLYINAIVCYSSIVQILMLRSGKIMSLLNRAKKNFICRSNNKVTRLLSIATINFLVIPKNHTSLFTCIFQGYLLKIELKFFTNPMNVFLLHK